MKRIITSLAISVIAVLAANAELKWLKTKHDFGAFSEDLASVDAVFQFINAGDKPVRILDARATCGCTRPDVTKGAIEPGDTAYVKVTYLATGRPGRFSKNVYVKTSEDPHRPKTLTINGVVIGSNATLAARYPVSAGKLRLQTTSVAFGEVKRGQLKSVFIDCYNQSTDTLRPEMTGLPPYIDYSVRPAVVPPGEQTLLAFTLQTLKNPDWGITSDVFRLIPCAGQDPVDMDFFTIITEDFDKLTPGQRINAPIAELGPMRVDIGEIRADAEPLKLEFTISNSGKLPLIIRRVQVVDPSISHVKLHSEKIKPGKSAKLSMLFTPADAETEFINAHVSIITNDPSNSLLVGRVTAEIIR